MGGYGSGNHTGRPIVESYRSLNVNRLNRKGLLRGWSGTWAWWNIDDEQTASISLNIHEDQLTASGSLNGDPWHQSCIISWTPCNFGGWRPWFCCPNCYGRVVKLYIGLSGLACRKCYHLAYSSTRQDAVTRVWRKQEKLEAKLIDGEDVYIKPKGMHWKTFERIVDQIEKLELKKNQLFLVNARRIIGW